MNHPTISSRDYLERRKDNPVFTLDVRTAAEFEQEQLDGSVLMPLQELDAARFAQACARRQDARSPIYLLCKSGRRSGMAADKIRGFSDAEVVVIDGGIEALKTAGATTKRSDRATMDLERQVRIAAGALVLTGVVLGALINPVCYWLAGFVGAGLVFAGVTDTCAMGMLLARMPWNQSSKAKGL